MSDKLKSFERQQTTWEGLWYQPEWLGFSSAAINLSKLKAFKGTVILYVRKNKYYKEGSNRPNYVFSIRDAKSEAPVTPDVIEDSKYATKDENGYWYTSDGERLYTYDDACAAINEAIEDTKYTSYDDMFASYYLDKV